jgi:regulator of ribonuclease activity A
MLTSDVLDLSEDACVCSVAMRLLGQKREVAGGIRIVCCFEDNALVKAAMTEPSDGEVLVIDGGGSMRTALMGDQIASIGAVNGWAGAIVFGVIRDSVAIDVLAFQVKTRTNPRKSSKTGSGEHDVLIELGGTRFVSGWFLYSDADGLVVLSEPIR